MLTDFSCHFTWILAVKKFDWNSFLKRQDDVFVIFKMWLKLQ